MNRLKMYEYAEMGVYNYIEILEKLYNMCLEVCDGDAAEEYANKIEDVKCDLIFIKRMREYYERKNYGKLY